MSENDEVIRLDEGLVIKTFGNEATPEFINMLRLGKAAYEHGYHGFISEEKVVEWAKKMYIAGRQQREIRDRKRHGKITINSSDVISGGSYLDVFGKRKGFLSE